MVITDFGCSDAPELVSRMGMQVQCMAAKIIAVAVALCRVMPVGSDRQ
jgi:hypothetical protein